jgi:hypothetical protein
VTAGSLGEHLVTLAGTPDDDPTVPADLIIIAQLATDRIGPVSYASITRYQPGGYVTVAASSDLALAVDEAQYADGAGPCLETLDKGHMTEVPDISATMAWPGFRDTASTLGLRASLSVPLFAGRGTPIAALNLYSHDPAAMRPLSRVVGSVYGLDETDPAPEPSRHRDAGAKSLLAGLTRVRGPSDRPAGDRRAHRGDRLHRGRRVRRALPASRRHRFRATAGRRPGHRRPARVTDGKSAHPRDRAYG